ncbi:quinol oxidase [Thauera chlorobenzoica]|nr:quinol oxidase [Thauera chlorobenzoica]SEF99474.1 hypothetical protein SAMN05216242_11235 [Thauera chlorobenzoica]
MKARLLARASLITFSVLVGNAPATAAEPAAVAVSGADGVQRIAIVGGSYFFRPARIVARSAPPLEIMVSMESGLIPHRFVLEAADGRVLADVPLAEQPQTLRFELPAGEYAFHCPNRLLFFSSHRERGMSGVLRIEE